MATQPTHRHLPHPGLRLHTEKRATRFQNRLADSITAFAGSMPFVYIHIGVFAWWIITDGKPFDDPFPFGLLTMAVSLEAIFLTAFVLLSQNRADIRRQIIADHEWALVQEEDAQNRELLSISSQLLELTRQVHSLTAEVHARVTAEPSNDR